MERKKRPLNRVRDAEGDKPIPAAYKEFDTDLARGNLENDLPAADLQDL